MHKNRFDLFDVASFPAVPFSRSYLLPQKSGVYLVVDSKNTVQYIGRSSNIRARCMNHTKKKEFALMDSACVFYLLIRDLKLTASVEAVLIHKLTPLLNRQEGRPMSTPKTQVAKAALSLEEDKDFEIKKAIEDYWIAA